MPIFYLTLPLALQPLPYPTKIGEGEVEMEMEMEMEMGGAHLLVSTTYHTLSVGKVPTVMRWYWAHPYLFFLLFFFLFQQLVHLFAYHNLPIIHTMTCYPYPTLGLCPYHLSLSIIPLCTLPASLLLYQGGAAPTVGRGPRGHGASSASGREREAS